MALDQNKLKQAEQLYINGKTILEIEKNVEICQNAIRRHLRTQGIYNVNRDTKITKFGCSNPNFFSNIDTEEKSYWLGFIYADGSLITNDKNKSTFRLTIGLSKKDQDHLQKIANIFNKPIKNKSQICTLSNNNNLNELAILHVQSKQVFQDLINIGIEQRKTFSNSTKIIDNIPEQLINHFIRGLFDGDGSISYWGNNKRNSKFAIYGTEPILKKIQNIMIKNIPKLTKTKISQGTNIYNLEYSSKFIMKNIYEFLYTDATIWLERKRNKFKEILEAIKFVDRENPPYIGVNRQSPTSNWTCKTKINSITKYIGIFSSELEAAYYYDLEQVRQRGKNAKQFMNFPSKYNDFVQWIKDGY